MRKYNFISGFFGQGACRWRIVDGKRSVGRVWNKLHGHVRSAREIVFEIELEGRIL